jgi:hypothetical protein
MCPFSQATTKRTGDIVGRRPIFEHFSSAELKLLCVFHAAAASKLLRTYAIQVETLRRLRSGGSQYMRIEHIHIESHGQAVIGNLQNRSKEDE